MLKHLDICLFQWIHTGAGTQPFADWLAVIFAESGPHLLVLLFVVLWFRSEDPKKMILIEATEAAAFGPLPIIEWISAVPGDNIGYYIGKRFYYLSEEGNKFFNKKNLLLSYQKMQFVEPETGKNFIGDQFFTEGKAYMVSLQ